MNINQKLLFSSLTLIAAMVGWVSYGNFEKSSQGGNFELPPAVLPFQQDLDDQDSEDLQNKLRAQARQEFMRGKLQSNQEIVEGLTTNRFDKILEGSRGVTNLVKGQHWFVIDDPEYRAFSAEMEKIAGRLNQAAENKNMEAATLRYFELTLNCIDCHRYIEGLRLDQ